MTEDQGGVRSVRAIRPSIVSSKPYIALHAPNGVHSAVVRQATGETVFMSNDVNHREDAIRDAETRNREVEEGQNG